jgi:hypothetical protein
MSELPLPNTNAPLPPMSFIVEDAADAPLVQRLERQLKFFTQAFPEFNWTTPGILLIPRTEEWTMSQLRALNCSQPVIDRMRIGFRENALVWGKGGNDCNGVNFPLAVIANGMPPGVALSEIWDFMFAGEFSEVIRAARAAQNPIPSGTPFPITYQDLNMPVWMREGVEGAFYSIAKAKQTRKWEWWTPDGGFSSCTSTELRQYSAFTTASFGCHYILGWQATQLMLALYGWDAAAAWFGGYGNQRDPYVAFKNTYGDDYDTFERYFGEYMKWKMNRTPMSKELLDRLG